jgi:hypothetical protein
MPAFRWASSSLIAAEIHIHSVCRPQPPHVSELEPSIYATRDSSSSCCSLHAAITEVAFFRPKSVQLKKYVDVSVLQASWVMVR